MTNSGWRPPVARYARIRQRLFILRPELVFPTSLWGPKCIIILLGGGASTVSSPSLVSPHTPNLNILVVFNKIYTFIHWWFFWWQCWRWQRLQSLTDYDDQYLDWLPAQYYWQPREGREKNSRDLGKWITTMGVARRFFQNIGGSNIKHYLLISTLLQIISIWVAVCREQASLSLLAIFQELAQTNDDEDNWPIYLTHYHPMSTLEVAGDNRPECRHSPLD